MHSSVPGAAPSGRGVPSRVAGAAHAAASGPRSAQNAHRQPAARARSGCAHARAGLGTRGPERADLVRSTARVFRNPPAGQAREGRTRCGGARLQKPISCRTRSQVRRTGRRGLAVCGRSATRRCARQEAARNRVYIGRRPHRQAIVVPSTNGTRRGGAVVLLLCAHPPVTHGAQGIRPQTRLSNGEFRLRS